jgi:hypothetical protein
MSLLSAHTDRLKQSTRVPASNLGRRTDAFRRLTQFITANKAEMMMLTLFNDALTPYCHVDLKWDVLGLRTS